MKGDTRYNGYGLRESWLSMFFDYPDFWESTNLGGSQLEAFKKYLIDAGLMTRKRENTKLMEILRDLWFLGENSLVWQIILIELTEKSPIFQWWREIPWGEYMARNEIEERLSKKGTLSFINTLLESPLGIFCNEVRNTNKRNFSFFKIENARLRLYTVGYCIYKLLEREGKGRRGTTVSEIFESPNCICQFGLSRWEFEKYLRTLKWMGFLSVDLVADLDNIFLVYDSPIQYLLEVLRYLEQQKEKEKFLKMRKEVYGKYGISPVL